MSDTKASILPSFDRSNSTTPAGFFAELKRIWDVADETCIPAIVEEYDSKTHIAKVSPLPVRVFDTIDGEVEKRAESVEVPVLSFAHGGFIIDAPLFRGDTGYIIAANKSCETIRNNNGDILDGDLEEELLNDKHDRADTFATKQYAWGFFMPCSWAKNNNANKREFVIKSVKEDGGYVHLDEDGNATVKNGRGEYKEITASLEPIDIYTPYNDPEQKDGEPVHRVQLERRLALVSKPIKTTLVELAGGGYDNYIFTDKSLTPKKVGDMSIVAQMRYDLESHQIQVRVRDYVTQVDDDGKKVRILGVTPMSDWIMVEGGQAVEHSVDLDPIS